MGLRLTLVRRDRSWIASWDVTEAECEAVAEAAYIHGEIVHDQARYQIVGYKRPATGEQVEAIAVPMGGVIHADIDC